MKLKKVVVAIDGPAGAGKSTVAQLAAKTLGYTYIDTGAMYRAVAWRVLQENQPVTEELILRLLPDMDIRLSYTEGKTRVFVDGEEITGQIRTPRVSSVASQVAGLAPVREKLVALQREMGRKESVLMDGRDIGTHVFPEAEVKIFLTASLEERAKRRYLELRAKGLEMGMEEIKMEIAARDKADSERAVSPLVQAKDALLLDTTGLSIDEVVARIVSLCGR
ncbi:MAG: (d)CMP kinase [Selenomonadaceae bacterium]|nr:(d)CMP kinase [Selenomonadaceae bacterium]